MHTPSSPNVPSEGQHLSTENTGDKAIDGKIIDIEEFAKLALSRLSMNRIKDPTGKGKFLGMEDPRTKERYYAPNPRSQPLR